MPTSVRAPHAGALSPAARDFLAERHYASIATIDADGSPRQAVVWYRLEDDGTILVNSRDGRRWPANLRRDPRVALSVMDEARPIRWLGLTGRVESIDDEQATAQADIAALARRYDPPQDADSAIAGFRTQRRVSFRIRPLSVHEHL